MSSSNRFQTPPSEQVLDPDIPNIDTALRKCPRPTSSSSVSNNASLEANARLDVLDVQDEDAGHGVIICIVSNASDKMDVIGSCHVTSKATPHSTLNRLEWAWCMRYSSLNLDTRENIQTLTSVLQRWFDKPNGTGWLWVPMDEDVLLEMHEKYIRQGVARYDPKKVYGSKNLFTYKLVAHKSMNRFWSLRRYNGSHDTYESSAITQYEYPFLSFPNITTHLHPHFVIADTGAKLVELFGNEARPDFGAEHATGLHAVGALQAVLDIYRKWISSVPPQSFLDGDEDPIPGHKKEAEQEEKDEEKRKKAGEPIRKEEETRGERRLQRKKERKRLEEARKKAEEEQTQKEKQEDARQMEAEAEKEQARLEEETAGTTGVEAASNASEDGEVQNAPIEPPARKPTELLEMPNESPDTELVGKKEEKEKGRLRKKERKEQKRLEEARKKVEEEKEWIWKEEARHRTEVEAEEGRVRLGKEKAKTVEAAPQASEDGGFEEAPVEPQAKKTAELSVETKPNNESPDTELIKGPGPFDPSYTTPVLPSALATARIIEDLYQIQYSEGIIGPKSELNVNARDGKFRSVIKEDCLYEKPDRLAPLDTLGLELADQSFPMNRGGSGRHRQPSGVGSPNPNSVGLGIVQSGRSGKAGPSSASLDGAGGAPLGGNRTRSKRDEKPNKGNKVPVERESPEVVDSQVKGLLGELNTENFGSISDQIITWANKSEKEKDGRTLLQVTRLVLEKASDEATSSEMCARLCRKMMEQISHKVQDEGIKNQKGKLIGGGQLFRKYLLNRCQEDFERGWVAEEATTAAATKTSSMDAGANKDGESVLYSDEYYAAQKAKCRGFGLIKFIGELFKLQMLTERIMHECIEKLLGNVEHPEEEGVGSLCTLLTTVGSILDSNRARIHMDVYFSRMKELAKSPNVSSRMQFMLQDIIELRERKWLIHDSVAATTIPQRRCAGSRVEGGAEGGAVEYLTCVSLRRSNEGNVSMYVRGVR